MTLGARKTASARKAVSPGSIRRLMTSAAVITPIARHLMPTITHAAQIRNCVSLAHADPEVTRQPQDATCILTHVESAYEHSFSYNV